MVLKATFNLSGRSCQVVLNDAGLSWEPEDDPNGTCRVPTAEILSCWPCPRGKVKCCPSSNNPASQQLSKTSHPTNTSSNSFATPPLDTYTPTDTYTVADEVKSPIEDSQVVVSLNEPGTGLESSSTASLLSAEALTPADVLQNTSTIISPSSITFQPSFEHGHTHHCNASYQVHPSDALRSNDCAYQDCGGGSPSSLMKEEFEDRRSLPIPRMHPPCRHTTKDDHFPGLSIEVCQRVMPRRWLSCGRPVEDDDDDVVLTEWKTCVFVFHHVSREVVSAWNEAIWAALRRLQERPRCLVIIINPFGGRKKAMTIYSKTVAPLLQRASIDVTVHTTTHSGHAQELAQEAAFTAGVDGVVAVGGDGIVTEVVNGLMWGALKMSNVDANDPNVPLPDSSVRLGVIPAGSTDAYINSLNGTRCALTSALHIIMGSRRRVDVAGLYSESKLDRFVASGIHLGFLGGLQETGSKLRHLGPFKDIIGFLKEMTLNRSYPVSMRVLTPDSPLSSPFDPYGCSSECTVCARAGEKRDDSSDQQGTWVEVKGEYGNLTSLLVSLQCVYVPHGVSPAAHVGDGTTDLVLMPKCSHFRMLINQIVPALSKNSLRSSHVQVLRARQVQFSDVGEKTPWSYDGELNYSTGLLFKVHCQRLNVFCRGPERPFASNAPCKRRAL